MKLQRYETYDAKFDLVCKDSDVTQLEASHAEILDALKSFVSTYGNPDVQRWMTVRDQARAAIAKAEGQANKRLKVVQSYMVVDPISGASWSSDSWTRADAEAEAERLEEIWKGDSM